MDSSVAERVTRASCVASVTPFPELVGAIKNDITRAHEWLELIDGLVAKVPVWQREDEDSLACLHRFGQSFEAAATFYVLRDDALRTLCCFKDITGLSVIGIVEYDRVS